MIEKEVAHKKTHILTQIASYYACTGNNGREVIKLSFVFASVIVGLQYSRRLASREILASSDNSEFEV